VLEDKFRITREIGRGGMAAVYEAENIDIGKRVAVKILAAELITSRVVRERFIREARAAAAIRSPYICDVYDSGMYEERPFLVMELLEGESLYDLLSRARRLDVETTLTIATHAARGLAKAHDSNVVHRDLKPENIFLTRDEEGQLIAKILDFGLAKFYEPTGSDAETVRLTREGALFGTPAYMSPEQAKGQGEVDHRADLWALGCIVYECLTGQTVWSVDQGVAMILAQIAGAPLPRPSRLRPDLPPNFDRWFQKALNRDPTGRFQTAKEFADSLNEAMRPDSSRSTPGAVSGPPREDEGRAIDELIASLKTEQQPRSAPTHVTPAPIPPAPVPTPVMMPSTPSSIPPFAAPREGRRAIVYLFTLAALALAGYAAWFYVLHPPGGVAAGTAVDVDAGSAKASKLQETEPYALQIGAGQDWLRKGKAAEAVAMFKEAYKGGASAAARSMLSHADIVLEEYAKPQNGTRCTVTGLGRPRPFNVGDQASRPTIAIGSAGPVVAWADSHLNAHRQQAFSCLLDESLRRISAAHPITPESEAVRHPQLMPAGEKLAFIYWDGAGKEPGVYVRLLEPDGRIAGPARRISAIRRHPFYPAMTRAEDGGFWAVWQEEAEDGVSDIVGRRLTGELKPAEDAVRLTALALRGKIKDAASVPDVAIGHGHLNVVFSVQRTPLRYQVMLLRVPVGDPALKTGVSRAVRTKKRKGDDEKAEDRYVGTMLPLSTAHGKNNLPRVACNAEGCLAVWDDETAGAAAAFIDGSSREPLWRREFAANGSRPAIGSSPSGTTVAWYEESRLKLARISRDGIGPASILTRVSGHHPYPAIVPGSEKGEWFISWRDYEAGHFEAFILRAKCP
jgi:serine/threonine-protein kinase